VVAANSLEATPTCLFSLGIYNLRLTHQLGLEAISGESPLQVPLRAKLKYISPATYMIITININSQSTPPAASYSLAYLGLSLPIS